MALVWGEWLAAVAGDVVGKGLRLGMGEGVRVSRKTEPVGMTRGNRTVTWSDKKVTEGDSK